MYCIIKAPNMRIPVSCCVISRLIAERSGRERSKQWMSLGPNENLRHHFCSIRKDPPVSLVASQTLNWRVAIGQESKVDFRDSSNI